MKLQIVGPNVLAQSTSEDGQLIKEPKEGIPAMPPLGDAGGKVKQDTSTAQRLPQGPAKDHGSEKNMAFGKAALAELPATAHSGLWKLAGLRFCKLFGMAGFL